MNKLKAVRMSLGLTQPQVSEELKKVEPHADVGVISRYENGVCLPTPAQMAVLEEVLHAERGYLYDIGDIDLLPTNCGEVSVPGVEQRPRKHRPETKYRKCFRIPRPFAESLPPDLLAVCGHSSWQSWFDAAMKRLLAEYAARKKYTGRKESGS